MGEYAVLDGAPALVAAIDRGVSCTVFPNDQFVVSTPYDDRFVRPALEAVQAPPARYMFEDWNPVQTGSKPGFGGSAAAAVAAVIAGGIANETRRSPHEIQTIATAVHRAVQGGGSGIDVAASAHGGILRFQQGQVSPQPPVEPIIVWSGQSAQTGPRVRQYLAWQERDHFAQRSKAAVDEFAMNPIEAMREMTALLDLMSRKAEVDYWTPALREITRIATQLGGAAKPSGAGGGDIAVALLPPSAARADFDRQIRAAGLQVIPANLCLAPQIHSPDGPPHA